MTVRQMQTLRIDYLLSESATGHVVIGTGRTPFPHVGDPVRAADPSGVEATCTVTAVSMRRDRPPLIFATIDDTHP